MQSRSSARGDFHLHSNYSDGLHSPARVVQRAAAAGLQVIALTDHDVTDGLPEAREEAARGGLRVVAGVEISGRFQGTDIHLLGLGFDPSNPDLASALLALRTSRTARGAAIVEKLRTAGAPLELQRVLDIAGHGSIGRPHVAHALVESGFAGSVDEAFSRWLSRGRPGFIPSDHIEASVAFELVHGAGGITALAHPSLYHQGLDLVRPLAAIGLDAVEAFHPDISPAARGRLLLLAEELDLLVTGGSDDHGFKGKECLGTSFLEGAPLDRLLQRLD